MDNNQNGGYPDNQGYPGTQSGYGMPNQGVQPGYGMQDQGMQPGYGMQGQGMQPGYGMPNQGIQPGYEMPNQGIQPGYGMPNQGIQPGYGMPNQGMQSGYGMPEQPVGGGKPPKKKKTGLIIGIVILAVILILTAGGIFAFLKFGKKDGKKNGAKDAEAAKQTVVDFCEGMKNQDMGAIVDAYHPDLQPNVEQNFYNANGVSSEDELWDHYDTVFGGYTFTYEADDAEKVQDSQKDDILDTVNSAYGLSIQADTMYEVDTVETYSGSNGEMTIEEQIYLVEEDGTWYVVSADSTTTENTLTAPATEDTEAVTEAETTEAMTEAETTTESAGSGSTPVNAAGFDWTNMQFVMKGTTYNLSTLTYADIQAMGYTMNDDYMSEELEDNQYSTSARATAADGSDMYIRFKNFTGGGTKKVTDCEILGVELSRDTYKNNYDAALGNGITFDMTVDDVKAVMGEPTDSYTSDSGDFMTLTYEENDEAYANSVKFTISDGKLIKITLENYQ